MKKITSIKSGNPLLGTWRANDGFPGILVTIEANLKGFRVTAIDDSDGEIPEVYDLRYQGDVLSFNLYFNSNGRLIKYRFQALSNDRVDVTFTYTEQETWEKIQT